MKLGYTIIYVENVIETVEFYKIALGLKVKFIHESQTYGEMDTGETTLAFASETLAATSTLDIMPNRLGEKLKGFEIAFVTDNVEKSFAYAVKKGAQKVCDPVKKPWGQMVGYLTDPNGVLIELCSPLEDGS